MRNPRIHEAENSWFPGFLMNFLGVRPPQSHAQRWPERNCFTSSEMRRSLPCARSWSKASFSRSASSSASTWSRTRLSSERCSASMRSIFSCNTGFNFSGSMGVGDDMLTTLCPFDFLGKVKFALPFCSTGCFRCLYDLTSQCCNVSIRAIGIFLFYETTHSSLRLAVVNQRRLFRVADTD